VVLLNDDVALDSSLVGAKAANLARAARGGLPVLPGFVLTTEATRDSPLAPGTIESLRSAWEASNPEHDALVVRSSSTVEDASTSSMAGQFTSVLGVRGWSCFLDAVTVVLASASRPLDELTTARPMAVLVQNQLDAACSGVLFGLDPVTGSRRHIIVEAVEGTPDVLVSGAVSAAHCVLGRRGRLVGGIARPHRLLLTPSRRRRLAHLARDAQEVFHDPQDIEWAFDRDDRLWLLQSRSVTAVGEDNLAQGPVLGPGPVAETFPDPLRPLEVALWVEPLRGGVEGALHVTGAVGRRRLDASPVVTTIGGWVAVDLELFGVVPQGGGVKRLLNPARGARRLGAAWRVGRLRAALPGLSSDLIAQVDQDLASVPDLRKIGDRELLDLLQGARAELVAVHGHEVLAGMILHGHGDRSTAAAVALAALRQGRADGLSDEDLVARAPVVLALLPPKVGPGWSLPPDPPNSPIPLRADHDVSALGCREALRLRCRWLQELSARVSYELATRLVDAGVLESVELVRDLSLDELRAAVVDHRVPTALRERQAEVAGPPLPMAFKLSPSSVPVAVSARRHAPADGLPASAGRAAGLVCHDPGELESSEPCVLIVDTLDPRLAPQLSRIAGLVSETGSALSHLAILAREMRVPTVVAVPEALTRFPAGTYVVVDGSTGEVRKWTPSVQLEREEEAR
jgi:pyruvate,water dikinase